MGRQSRRVTLAGSPVAQRCHAYAFFHDREQEYRLLLPFVKGGFEHGAQPGVSLLRLSSGPSSGTTAELWLPAAQGLPALTDLPEAASPQPVPPCTILLVDDDALISMATTEMLKDLGHRVIEAASGRRALEILRAGTAVDLIISDQAMPGMTGTQLAAEIRAAWPGLPVIIATGYADLPEDRDRKLPRLHKPYGQDDLVAAIDQLLRARAAPSP